MERDRPDVSRDKMTRVSASSFAIMAVRGAFQSGNDGSFSLSFRRVIVLPVRRREDAK